MKNGKLAAVVAVLALTVVAAILAVMYFGNFLQLGLDLKGGVQVRLEAEGEVTDEDIEKVMGIMETRINSLGVSEPTIQREGTNRVLIEMPGYEDPEAAIEVIGKTAQLSFCTFDEEGNAYVVMDGSMLKDANEAIQNSNTGTYQNGQAVGQSYVVQVEFNDEGTQAFGDLTTQLCTEYASLTSEQAYTNQDYRRHIGIYLDGEVISLPYVNEPINGGSCIITGFSTLEDAHNLAILLKSGALPVNVNIVEKRTIGPTLGSDSIDKSKVAGLVGLIIVMILMILYYKVPGVVAAFSLVLYTVLLLGAMALVGATLTMPGILGVLLSVGMCITNNIIIYERLKEEIGKGKTLRSSIRGAFDGALWTIIDSNVTTLLAAAVLFWKGTGSIKGFAVTLSIGIVISMLTAIFYTKFLLVNIEDSGLCTNPVLFGGKKTTEVKEA